MDFKILGLSVYQIIKLREYWLKNHLDLPSEDCKVDRALSWIKSAHHLDGCQNRNGKKCSCGKFDIETELSMKD
jgi:hypothetical protein